MRPFKKIRLVALFAAMAASACCYAQDSGQAQQTADELELIDEVEQPTITIRKPDARREITERREQGTVKEIKVETGISTYYLYPNDPLGSSFRDATSTTVRPAMWRIHEFDVTGQRPDDNKDEFGNDFDYTSDAPAPPTTP